MGKNRKHSIQSIQRAINIMELFDLETSELTIKEISEQVNLAKSTVHGLVKSLEFRGFLQQDLTSKKYSLGIRLFQLGNIVNHHMDIRKISNPYIEELSEQVEETVHLVNWNNKEAVYIEKVQGPYNLGMYSQIGKSAPIHCTGVGKVILGFLPDDMVDEVLNSNKLKKFTFNTIIDKVKIKDNLLKIRANGYALDDEEIEVGLRCVAAPVLNYKGEVLGAVSCAGPKHRITDEKINFLIEKVKGTGLNISEKLGYKKEH